MKKEEILEKARKEKTDEREKFVNDRSAVWMAVAMALASAFFVCVRGEDAPMSDLAAICCFSASVCFVYRFVRLKQVYYLIMALVMAALTVVSTIRFFQGH